MMKRDGFLRRVAVLALALCAVASSFAAEPNAVRAVDAGRDQGQQVVRIQLRRPLAAAPAGFSTVEPPRIVIDLPDTVNATAQARRLIDSGDVRHVDIVQASGRTRLVLNLKRPQSYTTRLRDGELQIVLGETAAGASSAAQSADTATERNAVVDIDFRRGEGGVRGEPAGSHGLREDGDDGGASDADVSDEA